MMERCFTDIVPRKMSFSGRYGRDLVKNCIYYSPTRPSPRVSVITVSIPSYHAAKCVSDGHGSREDSFHALIGCVVIKKFRSQSSFYDWLSYFHGHVLGELFLYM